MSPLSRNTQAVAAIMNPAARNRRLDVGGPKAVTWAEVVQTYEAALGRLIPVRYVAPGEHVDGILDVLLSLLAGYDRFDSDFDSSALAVEFGVTQTPLAAWVRAWIAANQPRIS